MRLNLLNKVFLTKTLKAHSWNQDKDEVKNKSHKNKLPDKIKE